MTRVAVLASLLLAALLLPGCYGPIFGGRSVGPEDYIRGDYRKWHVEVDYSAGERPASAILSFAHDKIAPLVNKPDGMEFQTNDQLPAEAGKVWSDADVLAYARQHRSVQTGGTTVVTHLMFLSGRHATEGVLAVTYDYDLIAVFPQVLRDSCTPLNLCTSPDPALRAVLLHEFGHALGLVNRGIAMVHPHEATECNGRPDDGHSSSTRSVMFCAVETREILALLRDGGIPQDFDANDKEDLQHARDA